MEFGLSFLKLISLKKDECFKFQQLLFGRFVIARVGRIAHNNVSILFYKQDSSQIWGDLRFPMCLEYLKNQNIAGFEFSEKGIKKFHSEFSEEISGLRPTRSSQWIHRQNGSCPRRTSSPWGQGGKRQHYSKEDTKNCEMKNSKMLSLFFVFWWYYFILC